ncbi:MAG: hypothetical protein JWM34_1740 [Ilumatobacteraceae bacterium]|nr:hypothetical protein [Ilumatobacteraceae bacterium]
MRARKQLTAIGAIALATAAIGGGAAVTSHAMGSTSPPIKGTLTIVSMAAGADGAITCTYDDVDLPAPGVVGTVGSVSTGTGTAPSAVTGEAGSVGVVTATASADGDGKPLPGLITGEAGSVTIGTGDGTGPSLETAGAPPAGSVTIGTIVAEGNVAGGPTLTPVTGAVPAIVLDSNDARPGTAEECAALKPTTIGVPSLPGTAPAPAATTGTAPSSTEG